MNDHDHRTRQRCSICEIEAAYIAVHVVVLGRVPTDGCVVVQCPICKRFICSDHAQREICWLGTEGTESFLDVILEGGFLPTLLCCPFDGAPLGQHSGRYIVLVNVLGKADALCLPYARAFVENHTTFLRCRDHDLSQLNFDATYGKDWPTEPERNSRLLERLVSGLKAFEAGNTNRNPGPRAR